MEREEKKRKDLNQDRADKLQAFLKAKPDFVYANFMRLELATRLAYLQRYAEAKSLCEDLAQKTPATDEGKEAQELLGYLRQQGFIK